MDIKDYKFKVGDEVIGVLGERGVIKEICDCDKCKERGFNELIVGNDDWVEYVTKADAEGGFKDYYRIGEYRFNDFDRDAVLRHIELIKTSLANAEDRLRFMDTIDDGVEACEKPVTVKFESSNSEMSFEARLKAYIDERIERRFKEFDIRKDDDLK